MFPLTVAQIDKVLFHGMVKSLNCPGSDGELTVLPHHIPLITTLKEGKLKIRMEEDKEEIIEVKRGILEVAKHEVVVLL